MPGHEAAEIIFFKVDVDFFCLSTGTGSARSIDEAISPSMNRMFRASSLSERARSQSESHGQERALQEGNSITEHT